MPYHEKYSRIIKSSISGLWLVCAALAVCLVWTVPGFAQHNRVTVTTYGDAAGAAARAAVTETFFKASPVEGGAACYLSPCAIFKRQYGVEGEGLSQTM